MNEVINIETKRYEKSMVCNAIGEGRHVNGTMIYNEAPMTSC